MKISIWDTYVEREQGIIMHFDIVVPEELKEKQRVVNYGMEYLRSKSLPFNKLSVKECRFCHFEVATPEIATSIAKNGFAIIEMENCY
jgi:hypothetical protein